LLDALQPSTVDAIHDALSDLDRSDLEAAYQELAAAYR
jgi:hypothetical protein